MGNCTSKKSAKSLKLSATKKTIFHNKMDKEQDIHTKGLSKKIVPFTKGEVTSFGFKKKIPSQLPIPVTLTSNGHSFLETEGKNIQNGVGGQKTLSDGYHSGSSIESLCHAPFRSTPKMIRKRDLVKQQIISPGTDEKGSGFLSVNAYNVKNAKTNAVVTAFQSSSASLISQNESNKFSNNSCNSGSASKNNLEPAVNRFGFRQPTPPRTLETIAKNSNKSNGVSHVARTSFLTDQGPYDTGSYTSKKKSEVSARSRSEGPREAFFRQGLQPANSVQSGLNQSKPSLSNTFQPGKFTLQTSHLPRPQFPVRMLDTKTAKTEANYYKRGVVPSSNSSKEGSLNEDSGFESHSSANNTLEKNLEILESSPGCRVRRRLPACKGKKLEMKIVGNKFELCKKEDEKRSDVVTEVSLIKLPTTNTRTTPVVINTGLVEQRTNQYLKRISQVYNKKDSEGGLKEPHRMTPISKTADTSVSSHGDEGLGAESEEEKLFKDSKKSEKYLMSDGCEEDMLSGEAMAEDISLCLSFEEETIATCPKNTVERTAVQHCDDVTPNTIRLDALKLSKQLKSKNSIHFNRVADSHRKDDSSSFGLLNECEKDDETFPSDSILEQLSSDSDSLGDKGENKNNDKEKNLKLVNLNLDKEDLGIDLEEDDRCSSKSDTDVEENELELNNDETDVKEGSNNCLGTASPDSPGTPTHASNSQSLSDGRDFLIDDEIADQPQLCFSETYVDCSCQEDAKTTNEKTLTTVNTEYVTCTEIKTFTIHKEEEVEERCVNGFEIPEVPTTIGTLSLNREEGRKRLNSEGTLSPCESIGSDDLMLDFETSSFEETADRQSSGVRNVRRRHHEDLSPAPSTSKPKIRLRTGGGKFLKVREENSGCTTPGSTKSPTIVSRVASSPLRPSRPSPADDDAVKVDKMSYDNMFQDIVSIKTMLLKLKRLLSESEGGQQENGRLCNHEGATDNMMEDELEDLRRQVLFLQQQLEEREKIVQNLKLEINRSAECGTGNGSFDAKKQCNAATQTGSDQFQQDFPHFRILQTTPVV